MLFRLIYASRAKASAATDLSEILEWSRAHNPGLGITGTLYLLDGTFIEHLEGEELVVNTLFKNIRHDPQHSQVTMLDQRFIPRRAYPEWSLVLKV